MKYDDEHLAHIETAALGRLASLIAWRMRRRKTRVLQDAQLLGRLDVVSEVAAGCVGFARAPDGFYVQDWIELHCQRFLRDLDEHVDAHLGRAADSGDDPDPEPEREQPVA